MLFFIFVHGFVSLACADTQPRPAKPLVVTLFWGKGCPHCEQEKAFLRILAKDRPTLVIREHEVWKNKENAALYKQVLEAAKVRQSGVPGTVVGTSVFLGFNEGTRERIAGEVARCLAEGCPDGVKLLTTRGLSEADVKDGAVTLPLVGTLDPARVSLPLFTVVIAGLDSFNPCAFFVLLFLLSLLVHARSRKRMFLIGGIFVLFSGLVYFLFMAAWLNIFLVIGGLTAITVTGGVIALLIGAVNVKDFFLFKQGVSLTIPDSAKPKLFERMRGLLKASSLSALLAGTIVLAVTANTYELLCTAGFPMVYTRVLTLQGLPVARYYQYLALYNIVYVVPLAVIVSIITVTLGARKLTEWQGRQLKLVSGLMMAALGGILIADPALLNNVLASAALLAGVVALSAVIIIITKRMKPEIGKQV
jgi:thiol-disulfide isomerase/thioredoxin